MAKNEDNNSLSKEVGDPAEFLVSNSKYHDCYLTVGNPETEEVVTIGVSASQLIAHSSVFRDMLADSKLADPSGSNTHIKDVSPATFKLMLRHVYGGKLPQLTLEEATDLALCADKYNIQRLMGKAAKRLKPTTAEDVFPAFMCVVYIKCPDLELQVSKIIQQETDKIVKNPKFLELDENCLLFLVKQTILNIAESDLWNNLVRWGENQMKECPGKTLRKCLNNILQHVRLLSLTSNEILEHLLPKNVLTPDELIDLSLAVSKKQNLQSPGLCKLQEKREIYKTLINKIPHIQGLSSIHHSVQSPCKLEQLGSKPYSVVTIKPLVNIEINSLTLYPLMSNPTNDKPINPISFTSVITFYKSSMGSFTETESFSLNRTVIPTENLVFQVKKSNGQSFILEANETYSIQIQISPSLPVYKKYRMSVPLYGKEQKIDETDVWSSGAYFKIKFENPFHVSEIGYRY